MGGGTGSGSRSTARREIRALRGGGSGPGRGSGLGEPGSGRGWAGSGRREGSGPQSGSARLPRPGAAPPGPLEGTSAPRNGGGGGLGRGGLQGPGGACLGMGCMGPYGARGQQQRPGGVWAWESMVPGGSSRAREGGLGMGGTGENLGPRGAGGSHHSRACPILPLC